MRKLKITVDEPRCVGNHACMVYAKDVFEADPEGRSRVVDPEGASEAEIIEAAYSCPVSAISVHDAATGEDLL